MTVAFIPTPGWEDEFLGSGDAAAATRAAAEAALVEADRIAPEDQGDYRAGLEVVEGDNDGESRLQGTFWTSALVEFGTSDTPTFAPLRRGTEIAGS